MLFRAGAGEDLANAFRGVASIPSPTMVDGGDSSGGLRYGRMTLNKLAFRIAGLNYGDLIYDLCRLVKMSDAFCSPRHGYLDLLYGVGVAAPGNFKAFIDAALARLPDDGRQAIHRDPGGIRMAALGGKRPVIAYARMPLLAAFQDLLMTVIPAEAQTTFDALRGAEQGDGAVKHAANETGRNLHGYLAKNIPGKPHVKKFHAITKALKTLEVDGQVDIDDGVILDFWRAHAGASGVDFLRYRTVLGAFLNYVRVLAEAGERVQQDDSDDEFQTQESDVQGRPEWVSPLDPLDDGVLGDLKVLTGNERKLVDRLMTFGPWALRWPLSIARAEIFGHKQERISQSRKQPDKRQPVPAIIADGEEGTYQDLNGRYAQVLEGLPAKTKAAAYVALQGDPEVDLEAEPMRTVAEEARAEFNKLRGNRASWRIDAAAIADPETIEKFRVAAAVLPSTQEQLELYLTEMQRIDQGARDLGDWYQRDGLIFREEFLNLDGELGCPRCACQTRLKIWRPHKPHLSSFRWPTI